MRIFNFVCSCCMAVCTAMFTGLPAAKAQPKDAAAFNRKARQQSEERNAWEKDLQPILKARQALPKPTDLSGYTVRTFAEKKAKSLRAIRHTDKAILQIFVTALSSPVAVQKVCENSRLGDVMGPLPKGSPSGKPLGEQSWQSWGSQPDNTVKQVAYYLGVQDGPSIIQLSLTADVQVGRKGQAQWKPLAQTDRLEMERIARLILRKLSKLGLTKKTFRGEA